MTGTLQNHARKYNIPIDALSFSFQIMDEVAIDDYEPSNGHAIKNDSDGVIVRGLYMEGARFDDKLHQLQDSYPMEMFSVSVNARC